MSAQKKPQPEIRVRQEKGYKVTTIIHPTAPEDDPVRYRAWLKLQRELLEEILQGER